MGNHLIYRVIRQLVDCSKMDNQLAFILNLPYILFKHILISLTIVMSITNSKGTNYKC
jgi:hypothetical protein